MNCSIVFMACNNTPPSRWDAAQCQADGEDDFGEKDYVGGSSFYSNSSVFNSVSESGSGQAPENASVSQGVNNRFYLNGTLNNRTGIAGSERIVIHW